MIHTFLPQAQVEEELKPLVELLADIHKRMDDGAKVPVPPAAQPLPCGSCTMRPSMLLPLHSVTPCMEQFPWFKIMFTL